MADNARVNTTTLGNKASENDKEDTPKTSGNKADDNELGWMPLSHGENQLRRSGHMATRQRARTPDDKWVRGSEYEMMQYSGEKAAKRRSTVIRRSTNEDENQKIKNELGLYKDPSSLEMIDKMANDLRTRVPFDLKVAEEEDQSG